MGGVVFTYGRCADNVIYGLRAIMVLTNLVFKNVYSVIQMVVPYHMA